jgi:hypothetical protein
VAGAVAQQAVAVVDLQVRKILLLSYLFEMILQVIAYCIKALYFWSINKLGFFNSKQICHLSY